MSGGAGARAMGRRGPAVVFPPDFRLYLASQSPRRRDLLEAAGIPHHVVQSSGTESTGGDEPLLAAEGNARAKAEGAAVPAGAPRPFFILGADTIVTLDKRVMGKPVDRADAESMLLGLSGRDHSVITGVALIREDPDGARHLDVGSAETLVCFRNLAPAQLETYLSGDEWRDKAGAYGIQGQAGLFVERIEGDYPNVVGLPLSLLVSLFAHLDFDLLARRWTAPLGISAATQV